MVLARDLGVGMHACGMLLVFENSSVRSGLGRQLECAMLGGGIS